MDKMYKDKDKILIIGHASNDKPYEMPSLHHHDYYELYFLEDGTRNYIINGELLKLSKMDVALIKPMALHKTAGEGYKRTLINFNRKFLEEYFTGEAISSLLSCFDNQVISITKNKFMNLLYFADKIEEDMESKGNSAFLYLANILNILGDQNNYTIAKSGNLSYTGKLVAKIMEYINNNYQNIEKISQIADEFYITKYHLCRIFKSVTQVSIINYINSIKVQNACELLRSTGNSINEISEACGFNSSMYFCKTFKEIINMTPTEYRKNLY